MTTALGERVILVTGAAGHIGAAIAARLVEAGARVIRSDLVPRADIDLSLDVTRDTDWSNAATQIEALHGRLDGLVHNAGILRPGALTDVTLDDWQRSFAVNVDSIFLGTRACWDLLQRSPSAAIVTLASVSGVVADRNMTAYNASKAAALMLTRTIALQGAGLTPPIRANAVLPSFVDSPMVDALAAGARKPDSAMARMRAASPIGRVATAGEIAEAVAWLLSPSNAFITGAELAVDGGLTAV